MDDSHDLAWLAGFWDGEGCTGNLSRYAIPHFTLGQAGDEGEELCLRVLQTANVGRGHVHGPYMSGGRKKPYYMARITGGKYVAELLEKCRPWLSRTKIAQAERTLEKWHTYRRENNVGAKKAAMAARTECDYGHPFDEKNTGSTYRGYRRCRRCQADREAARRALKKNLLTLPPAS